MKEGTGKFFEVLAEMEGDDCLCITGEVFIHLNGVCFLPKILREVAQVNTEFYLRAGQISEHVVHKL